MHKLITIRHAAVRSSYTRMQPRGMREIGTMTSQIRVSTSITTFQRSKQKMIQPNSNWSRITFDLVG